MRWSYFTTTRNDLKRPETIYNEQEMTWNDLPRARNDLKQSRASKKRLETAYRDSETTWNDPQQAKNNLKRPERTDSSFIEPFYLENNQLEGSNVTKSNRSIPCLQYFVSSMHIQHNGRQKNQTKCQNKAKRREETLNNHLTSSPLV